MTKSSRDVYMVTGYDEAIAVYHDQATFSNCNSAIGPFARFPVPLEGDDVSEIIETYRDQLPFSDQLPTFDPPKHTAHRGLLMRLITPKRLKENEEFLGQLADRRIDTFHARGGSSSSPSTRAPTRSSWSPTCSVSPSPTTTSSWSASCTTNSR